MTRLMLVILLWLVPGSAFAETPEANEPPETLASIQERLQRDGPKETMRYLFDRFERADVLLDGIASGEDAWLDIFLPLYSVSNAYWAETLSTSLPRQRGASARREAYWAEILSTSIPYAVTHSPVRALEVMASVSAMEMKRAAERDREPASPWHYSSGICGLTWLDWRDKKEWPQVGPEALRELDARAAALRTVNKLELLAERDACLARIEVSKAEWDERLNPPKE